MITDGPRSCGVGTAMEQTRNIGRVGSSASSSDFAFARRLMRLLCCGKHSEADKRHDNPGRSAARGRNTEGKTAINCPA